MTAMLTEDDYGVLAEPATLKIERLLPGPIDRVWTYLVDGELRRQWLAAGAMEQQVGAPVELVWRNDELTDPPGQRPDEMAEEHRMTCEVVEIDPPHKLAISWGSTGGVTFTLAEKGDEVLLTLVHKRVEDSAVLLNVSAGWHAHIDVLEARLRGTAPAPHWDNWAQLRSDYAERFFG
ncbi:SRPBCC family protein [Sphingopyxis indica]|uniref:SRPBCC family protein n=1 Tax=Sphingopyxis indica TaxID=436663 RepID=UPI002938DB78|nr:SRPBCC family protein [Sphingopyxis indica]WOF44028.1 SRPBCC family protein [Sphingopyxis indica]